MSTNDNNNEMLKREGSGMFIPPFSARKIMIGKHELKVSDLEKLIEFVQSGKLDEIMKS